MKRTRSGVTLIEVIVVVAILAGLLALLLPAVQSARSNASRAQCQNNLRQVALAVHHYESTRRSFPPLYNGTFAPMPEVALDEFHFHSWRTAILAELEQSTVLKTLDLKLPATDPANQPGVNQEVAVFLCPATANNAGNVPDIWRFNHGSFPVEKAGTAARSDYEAIGGVRLNLTPASHEMLGDMKFGVWGEPRYKPGTAHASSYRKARAVDVTDGLSKTLLMGERGGRPDVYEHGKLVTSYPYPPESGPDHHQAAWAISTHIAWLVYREDAQVNDSNRVGIYGFHASGANAAFADAAVQFLSDTTDAKVLKAMATRAAGD